MTTTTTDNLYDVLHRRGLVAQCTDDKIRQRLDKPVAAYIGFDPTADALHVGSLVQMMLLAHVQRCGHKPVVLVGGATGLVGDPSGKTDARQMLTPETINHNARAIADQIGLVVKFGDGPTDAVLVNNLDWFGSMGWIEMLRDVGSRMSVNRMLSMESVKGRMSSGTPGSKGADDASGITYLEFSYMLMQGYDFAHLHKEHGCTLQMGGQDQWGNIVIGIDLGRRLHNADLAGLTTPLVTKSDGGKFGKSEQGNVWLDAKRTSVFDFYQFWRNVSDSDVGRFLGTFTFLPMDEVDELARAQGKAINESKVRLAYEVTKLIHGEAAANEARDSAKGAFSGAADMTGDAIPSAALDAAELDDGVGLLALLVRAGLAKSNGEARRLIQGGGVRIHDAKVDDPQRTVGTEDVADGYILLRAGKKRMFRFDVA